VPVDLHQRLSEFSYGYGVTREVEELLRSVGLKPTPFLPNLLDEAKLGFDVAFERPGAALLIQFKLGEAVQRFRRADVSKAAPSLERPFWRFRIDTAEASGQYDLLLKAELAGAEVYYVAPRFTAWDQYVHAFEGDRVLRESLLVRPSEIRAKLDSQGEPDGWHRVVYDRSSVHICSKPMELNEVASEEIAQTVRAHIMRRGERADIALRNVYDSLGRRREIRSQRQGDTEEKKAGRPPRAIEPEFGSSPGQLAADRHIRLQRFRASAETEGAAVFAAVGVEAWAVGSQLIAVTLT
jgi:hypothetical protein